MTGSDLRAAVLLVLDEWHRQDDSKVVDDVEIAQELRVPVEEVRRQMDILEKQGFTNEANTMGVHSAWISPKGMLAAEEIRQSREPMPTRRKVGFDQEAS